MSSPFPSYGYPQPASWPPAHATPSAATGYHVRGFGPPPSMTPPPMAAPPEPIGPKVLEALKKAGRFSMYVVPAIVVAGTAIANEPGMAQAASNWKYGIAARLDDGIKQLLPQIVATSREGWIALDQEEFERVVWVFHREIGALRNVLGDIGGMLDEVAAGYRSYWLHLGQAVAVTVAALGIAKKMQVLPHPLFRLAGLMMEQSIGAAMTGIVATLTLSLASMLRAAGQVMSTLIKKDHQFGYVLPSDAAAVDFTQATISSKDYPSYREPSGKGRLPDGYQDFDWVAPASK
ncbi:hypothetical protein [Nonomuraea sp. LPB2021202275-12-8]|uniref:hypothetical protein n=1 Tax=Nonomuraea sp. LPB2021202275-12-8 TaxID=3120159 RepID=UPI00300C914B